MPSHSIVACIRHPLNVARSLEKRDGIALRDGLELWRRYNQDLLDTIKASSGFLGFDFDQGGDGATRLATSAAERFNLKVTQEALDHYTVDAHHHSETDELPSDIAQLYAELKQRINHGVSNV